MDKTSDMKIVEEALDVEEEEASDPSALDTCLDCVSHTQHGVSGRVVVLQAKLMGGGGGCTLRSPTGCTST